MKKLIISIIFIFVVGCTPQAHRLMPEVKYNQPVEFHIPKKAYLYWVEGKQFASEVPKSSYVGNTPMGSIIYEIIDSQQRKNNPSKYHLVYGKAQQTVFMTSLKDVLKDNRIFKDVELITDLKNVTPNDVVIIINFELTKVRNEKIILDVAMNIVNYNKDFKRTYFVQNDPPERWTLDNFEKRQINVSEKLMAKIIQGIKDWNLQEKK